MEEWDDQVVALFQEVNEIRLGVLKSQKVHLPNEIEDDIWGSLFREQLKELPHTVEKAYKDIFDVVDEENPQYMTLQVIFQDIIEQVTVLTKIEHNSDIEELKIEAIRLLGRVWTLYLVVDTIIIDSEKTNEPNKDSKLSMNRILDDDTDDKESVELVIDAEEQQDDAVLIIQRPVRKE